MEHLHGMRKTSVVLRGLTILLMVVLVGCGGTSGGDADSTATSDAQQAQPTLPSVEGTPDTNLSEEEIAVITPNVPVQEDQPTLAATQMATAADLTAVDEEALPSTAASPMVTADFEEVDGSTPASADLTLTGRETFTNPGDGTGGSGMPGENSSTLPADQIPNAMPVASPVASPTALLSVEGCEVPDVPAFDGTVSTFILTADVYFRSGPGADCDPLLDTPLGEGQTVDVIGGPVLQTTDNSEWVLIEVNDIQGWSTTEFIEPTE